MPYGGGTWNEHVSAVQRMVEFFSLNIRGGSIIYWFPGSYTEYYLIVVPSRLPRFLLLAVVINTQLHWPHSKAIPPARFLIISRNIHGI